MNVFTQDFTSERVSVLCPSSGPGQFVLATAVAAYGHWVSSSTLLRPPPIIIITTTTTTTTRPGKIIQVYVTDGEQRVQVFGLDADT
jgi:hypothetical protein